MDVIRADVAHVMEKREKLSKLLAARTSGILKMIQLGEDKLRSTMNPAKDPPEAWEKPAEAMDEHTHNIPLRALGSVAHSILRLHVRFDERYFTRWTPR